MQKNTNYLIFIFFLWSIAYNFGQTNTTSSQIKHVLHISVDGLRPDVITSLGAQNLPNFFRFRTEGAWTDNARTDVLNTSTIPGHTSHITGRPVLGDNGHGFWWNSDPGPFTLHSKGYVCSVFDVVHDYGYTTALYAGKSKFVLFENSYNANAGAPDLVGEDNGRDKIDTYVNNGDMQALANAFVDDYAINQYEYTFFHFRFPDGQGHSTGWELGSTSEYAEKVMEIDGLIGSFFQLIETTPGLASRTAIILTADHGGEENKKNHGNIFDPDNYTIPFYVWGPGIAKGADLYALNSSLRRDPGTAQPTDDNALLPIRYGEVANLALSLLQLPSVPGSVYNSDQSLRVSTPADKTIIVVQEGLYGYQGTKDTYIRRHKRNENYGGKSTLLVDDADPWWSGRDNQALLRFENIIGSGANQIPANSYVLNASLQLRVVNKGKGGNFHRMLRAWNENETWNTLNNGINANDQEAKANSDIAISDINKGILSVDVTNSVQAWANGTKNYGWAILPDGGNGWDCYSSEGFMPPRLVITYSEQAPLAKSTPKSIIDANTKNEYLKEESTEKIKLQQDVEPLLWGNFPNPFSETTTIAFSIAETQYVTLAIYDTQGQLIETLLNEKKEYGSHQIQFTPTNLSEGIYIVKLITTGSKGTLEQNQKIIFK